MFHSSDSEIAKVRRFLEFPEKWFCLFKISGILFKQGLGLGSIP